jgi:Tfp pilus assembly protein PilF
VDSSTDSLIALGRTALEQGALPAAEAWFRRAEDAGEDNAEVQYLLGQTALRQGDLPTADIRTAAALELAPGDPQIHLDLAGIRHAQGQVAEAMALYRRATVLAPDRADGHAGLGGMLVQLHHPDEALPHLERALALDPALTDTRGDAAMCLCAMNRFPDALEHYRIAHRLQPANNSARYLEALAQLALGDFANGWRKHEARWYAALGYDYRPHIEGPSWLGEDDLAGRTILLHCEQGMGDTIHFVRYAPLVADRGARVLLQVQAPLKPLLANLKGVAEVLARGETLPAFDTNCSLMSLPRAFRTNLDTIPAEVPYLAPPPEAVARWRNRLGPPDGRQRIALAWSGSTATWNREIPLALLAPLVQRPDVEFHVAQTEILPDDRTTLDAMPALHDHSHALADFADTAALVSLMDRVISVDTVLAHLGGALAKPTWTMLPLGADYRWMTTGHTSPWYPTMRLFRQPALYDWTSVVTAIVRALDRA